MVFLRKPALNDEQEIKVRFEKSKALHQPWLYPPDDYLLYLSESHRYFLCDSITGDIIGVFHISGIVRGCFQSAYLGYNVFYPFQGKGMMSEGIR